MTGTNVTSIPVANITGLSTNYCDLSTTQTIGGTKTFTNSVAFNGFIITPPVYISWQPTIPNTTLLSPASSITSSIVLLDYSTSLIKTGTHNITLPNGVDGLIIEFSIIATITIIAAITVNFIGSISFRGATTINNNLIIGSGSSTTSSDIYERYCKMIYSSSRGAWIVLNNTNIF